MDEREYRQNRSGNNNNKSPGPIHDYEQYMYGGKEASKLGYKILTSYPVRQ